MGRDDDDRRPDGDGRPTSGDPFSLDDLVIPDDARELDADARALRRERRARTRRARFRRLLLTRRWRRYGLSGPIVVVVLLLVAGFASLMLMFQPRRAPARPVPLATGAPGTGQEHELLPDLLLRRADGSTVPLRDYRPALVALLPPACGCDAALRRYGVAAARQRLAYVLVGDDLPDLPADLSDGAVVRAREPTGTLRRGYSPPATGLLLVLVRGDGIVNRVLTREPTESALDGELAVLVSSGSGR